MTKNSLNPQTNNQEQWEWPDVNLTKDDKRLIFSKVVEGYVGIFCDTQTYTWGGKYYRQVKGLPIGPRATSAIAKVVMNMFDRRFRLSMDTLRLGMKLYVIYIDDIRIAMRSIKLGAKVVNGTLEIDQEQKFEKFY